MDRHGEIYLCAAVLCLTPPVVGMAQQRPHLAITKSHDGIYAVDIATIKGNCDKALHWQVIVANGVISSPAGALMDASGQISPRGKVSLAFRRDNDFVAVTGNINETAGSGAWWSSTLQCSGTWMAVRLPQATDRAVAPPRSP